MTGVKIEEQFEHVQSTFYRLRAYSRAGEESIQLHNACASLIAATEAERLNFVKEQNEDRANLMLSYVHMFSALVNELRTILLLHTKEYDLAWSCLIESIDHIDFATLAHCAGKKIADHRQVLFAIEQTMFPEQIFCSPQFVYGMIRCSVCGEALDSCSHLEREVYMGKRCFPIIDEIEDLLEVSILSKEKPKDKRCRVGSYTWQEVNYNWMSQRPAPLRKIPSLVSETSKDKVVFEVVWPEKFNWWLAVEPNIADDILNREFKHSGVLGRIIATERSRTIDWNKTKFAIPKPTVKQFFIVRLEDEAKDVSEEDEDT
jgi:hypothetical protein